MFTKILVLFAFVSLGFILSCSDDDGTSNNTQNLALGTFDLKIDGSSWIKTTVVAAKSGSDDMCNITATKLSATAPQSVAIVLKIEKTGTFSDGIGTYTEMNTANPLLSKVFSKAGFTYTISAVSDTEVSGTFSFVATNDENSSETKNISDGKFRVKFLNQ